MVCERRVITTIYVTCYQPHWFHIVQRQIMIKLIDNSTHAIIKFGGAWLRIVHSTIRGGCDFLSSQTSSNYLVENNIKSEDFCTFRLLF